MVNARARDGLILLGGLALLVWAALPPDTVALTPSCKPAGGPATFSAMIFGKTFWRAQAEALASERVDLLAQPARRARAEAELQREMRENPSLEEKMMRLSREQGQLGDPAEKERQEAAAQSARLRRVAWLMECETEVSRRLGE